ncbi:MAG: serine/threonine-protein phosphatase [Desulfobulbaceae bacterium]|nr:serine/threonine-protein phosphatase [Desulfobulbaceae bacterium]
MKPPKLNCWEYKKCGREPGGNKADKDGICPAAAEKTFDTFNNGINAGRACWLVAGTFCDDQVSGTFAEKIDTCRNCDFYKQIQADEHSFSVEVENINLYAATHISLVRKANEDRYLVKKFTDGTLLFAVADGMGGQAAEILRGRLANMPLIPVGKEAETLSNLAVETDRILIETGERQKELEGLGTTLLCVLLRDGTAHWVHVGDSRFSIFRAGTLLQITQDQNLARYLLEEGEITLEEVAEHYSRNILDQAVGNAMEEPETGSERLEINDILLLSTDGFHNLVLPDAIIFELQRKEELKTRADSLVKLALKRGGTDNITIVMAEMSDI